ncbi:MAG: tRNA (N(6)-L-threonylcarbamoyladenosine(37)-C(2))-methylthiotransferase MtaB [Chloroflexota bacterium]|nr:MAG: tRNA (N(6)-L-threonylcarbamoyladenosine(37)-C(2))-methylthiotransferase MtaB [Chloroflexota bacterium]
MSMKVAFYTLGCKLNQAETESLAGRFTHAGFQLVHPGDRADIYIANTCTVTHIADRKSRHWLRLTRRRNPRALIIATGCYAQRNGRELAPLVDLVVDNAEKEDLLTLTQTFFPKSNEPVDSEARQSHFTDATTRTRSLIKIQDGCRSHCTYCIVPEVRPREYSLPASRIVGEVKQKVALGYREVILTGTKVGSYGDGVTDLESLVQRILVSTGVKRLRLSSLQPSEISPEFLALWQDDRLCRHFHLALQSGSATVLQRMKRSYSLDQYQRTVTWIKDMMPDAAITTDIIVGFPDESDDEFEQSYSFCQQAGFANIHVFPYSPRPETAAAVMPEQIKAKVKQARNQRMLELSQNSWRKFCEQFLGHTMPVLWEKETSPESGIYAGLTSNYIRVFAHSEKSLDNEITPVKLAGLRSHEMWGELTRPPEI